METLFYKILNMSLTASIVIIFVMAGRIALKRAPKIYSYVLWSVVLFRLLCPISVSLPLSALGFASSSKVVTDGLTSRIEYWDFSRGQETTNEIIATLENISLQSQPDTVHLATHSLSWAQVLPWIWLTGFLSIAFWGIGTYLRFCKRLIGAVPVKKNVFLVDHIDSAFVTGFFNPKIYLPSSITKREVVFVLAHERYHIRRFDHIVKHLSFLVLCLHWFNPLVWVAFVLSGKDMEMSCDEAVICKLGSEIRADYSASLISLDPGYYKVAGLPLAFGEGDIKGRIRNLSSWKYPRKWVKLVSLVLCLSILVACAINSVQGLISGNSGTNDVSQTVPSVSAGDTDRMEYTGSFVNVDATVEFTWNISQLINKAPLPLLETTAHYFSGEEVARICNILLPGASFYDAGADAEEYQYTKAQLQQKIELLNKYATQEAFQNLYISQHISLSDYQKHIDSYEYALSHASDSSQPVLVDWSLDTNIYADCNGVGYTVGGEVNPETMRNHVIIALDGDAYIESVLIYEMSDQGKPDLEQVQSITAKAQAMLNEMDLGSYCIMDTTVYKSRGGAWMVSLEATAFLEGALLLPGKTPYETDLMVNTDEASYPMENISLTFSAEGELVHFSMRGLGNVKSVAKENVTIQDEMKLISQAETLLMGYDPAVLDSIAGYHLNLVAAEENIPEEQITLKVEISRMDFGLARIQAGKSASSFYAIPAVQFVGTIGYYHKETGELLRSVSEVLLTLDASDGSVI